MSSKHITCDSCGMKAGQNSCVEHNALWYCGHCIGADGQPKSYSDKHNDFVQLLIKMKALSEFEAKDSATELMKSLPAWQ